MKKIIVIVIVQLWHYILTDVLTAGLKAQFLHKVDCVTLNKTYKSDFLHLKLPPKVAIQSGQLCDFLQQMSRTLIARGEYTTLQTLHVQYTHIENPIKTSAAEISNKGARPVTYSDNKA